MLIFARSVSLRAAASLRPDSTGRVLASFRSVCDLVTDAGDVVALVWGGIGNGPLNVVLDRGRFKPSGAALPAGAQFVVADQVLRVGGVAVDFSRATLWDARPDWERLRARRGEIVAAAAGLGLKPQADMAENLLKQVPRPPSQCASAHFGHISRRFQSVAGPAVEAAVTAFEQAWRYGSSADLQCPELRGTLSATCRLLGLGPGLTPAGDDWLAGWLLGQRLTADLRGLQDLEGLIAEIAPARTTTLSCAFLAAAAAGEADAAWHELLAALAGEAANQQISKITQRILRHGATSGAAMLAGFFASLDSPAIRTDP